MRTVVLRSGRIVPPAEIRRQDDIRTRQQSEIKRVDRGEFRLVRCEPARGQGLVDWLTACRVNRDPFTPFHIIMISGREQEVANPHLIAVGESQFSVQGPKSDSGVILRLHQIPAIRVAEAAEKPSVPGSDHQRALRRTGSPPSAPRIPFAYTIMLRLQAAVPECAVAIDRLLA